MSKRVKITIVSIFILVAMTASFAAGCVVINRLIPGTSVSGIEVIRQAWNIIFATYVDKSKLDEMAMSGAAIRALLETIDDPHSMYLTPEQYQAGSSGLGGTFEGIGADVRISDGEIQIIAPRPGSPAEKAGIKPGDIIMAIDGQSTAGMDLSTVVSLTRGPKGTTVSLLVLHEGETEPVQIDVVRAEIISASVYFEMMGDLAYLKISQFTLKTDEELDPVFAQLAVQGAKGIILDLRNNPGGMLDTVVKVIGRFVQSGTAVITVNNAGKQEVIKISRAKTVTDLPVVVLVNQNSASGSELLSGALQDYDRAVIAGATTYGKGSVDVLYRLDDGSGLYLTTSRWLTPDGRLIEGVGITPDVYLNLDTETEVQWAIDFLHGKS